MKKLIKPLKFIAFALGVAYGGLFWLDSDGFEAMIRTLKEK